MKVVVDFSLMVSSDERLEYDHCMLLIDKRLQK